ncbi:MAG TPA: DUF2934 domain-containing protein [Candidatus Competibacter sp.]|nr:DUF2934 domain-containing protein [Candidatus Competibacter sp.]
MPTSQQPEMTVPTDLRHAWIAEAAYYLAERRKFRGGCPLEDWLRAERVFDQQDAQSLPSPRMALVFLDRRSTDDLFAGT